MSPFPTSPGKDRDIAWHPPGLGGASRIERGGVGEAAGVVGEAVEVVRPVDGHGCAINHDVLSSNEVFASVMVRLVVNVTQVHHGRRGRILWAL